MGKVPVWTHLTLRNPERGETRFEEGFSKPSAKSEDWGTFCLTLYFQHLKISAMSRFTTQMHAHFGGLLGIFPAWRTEDRDFQPAPALTQEILIPRAGSAPPAPIFPNNILAHKS